MNSNFFQNELKTLLNRQTAFKKATYAGRAAFLPLSGNRRARIEFVTRGTADHYEALQITILDKNLGRIDRLWLRFKDYCASQKGGCSGTVIPHIWVYNGKAEWYRAPSQTELSDLAKDAHDYVMVFA